MGKGIDAVAYTDGACIGNPGPGGWGAILVSGEGRQEIGGGAAHTTNNRMELTAVIEALRRVPAESRVQVVTDSEYVLKGMTQWLPGWRRRGWRTSTGQPVVNQDLWETLSALVGDRVSWEWVRGHAGHPENERADALARGYARAQKGGVAPTKPPVGNAAPSPRRAQGQAFPLYLSLVDGVPEQHDTWEACRARIHGVRGARCKKCQSAAEVAATLADWRLPVDTLGSRPAHGIDGDEE
jgi:ribonuclease HI